MLREVRFLLLTRVVATKYFAPSYGNREKSYSEKRKSCGDFKQLHDQNVLIRIVFCFNHSHALLTINSVCFTRMLACDYHVTARALTRLLKARLAQ
jgi:hypothetical protein